MNEKRLITVIVPVYKVEEYLDRCINSIVEQTYDNLEIILVDDGSPDHCPELCDEWARKDKRIKVIHRPNGGLSAARNDGIRASNGEYLLFVDSDDYLENNACERFIGYADDVDIVIGEATIVENGKPIPRVHTNLIENYVYTGPEYSQTAIKKGQWFAAACYNFYRVNFLKENNLYFMDGVLHEDIDYTPRLFLAAKKVKYLHFQFYNYIIRNDSITGHIERRHFEDLLKIYSKWCKLNNTIQDEATRKVYSGALSKYFMASCREHKVTEKVYPEGMDGWYLIHNALNVKELIKALVFISCRRFYVRL